MSHNEPPRPQQGATSRCASAFLPVLAARRRDRLARHHDREARRQDPVRDTLPADASPSVEAVHNSIEWWVVGTITFAGLTGAIERVRREIIVHNA
jgi:hypothetical protein